MGHERLGLLPRRKPWTEISSELADSVNSFSREPSKILSRILEQVQTRYEHLYADKGVQAAFSFLVALSTPTKASMPNSLVDIGNPVSEGGSVLRVTAQLLDHIRSNIESAEYAELSGRAAADTITEWTKTRTQQQSLFGDESTADSVWQGITGSEFCEISRLFFSRLTERYLRYFIERDLTSAALTMEFRERFDSAISTHLDDVSRHAFETSKITESFSAGWFNKHAKEQRPTDNEIYGFLRVSSGKIREELFRERLGQ